MFRSFTLAAALSSAIAASAHAQGPGPVPNPWIVAGPTLSYNNGGITMPQNVTGGTKGVGTINVSGGFYVNGVKVGVPGGSSGQVQTNGGTGGFSGITNAQLTALVDPATSSLSGALPAFPGNTTTYFRGDGSYATLNCASLTDDGTACPANVGTSGHVLPFLDGANTFSAAQTVNLNAAALPSPISGAGFNVGAADGAVARVQLNAFGAIAAFTGVSYGGTNASKTQVLSGTQLTGINAYAYTGSAVVGPIVSFRTYAAENIAAAAWGTKACIATTPSTTAVLTDGLCQQNSGGVTIGSPTGGDKGVGTINAAGTIYINGTAVTAAGITALTGDGTATGPGSAAFTLATAQPGAHTWAAAQTFTLAPVFTDASGTRTALGLGALAVVTPGTGVATALAVNVGTAGSIVVNGGALGTPSSGTATNLTGTALGLTAGNVAGTGVASATSLALGGATIGSNALAVTGTTLLTGAVATTSTLTSGANGGTGGKIILNGSTSGQQAIQVAAAAGSLSNLTLPTINGNSGDVLSTNGAGVLTWIAVGGTGTVTSVAAGTGMSFSTITGTGSVAIDKATNSNAWAATSNKVMTSDIINSAGNPVALTDGATIAVDMATLINATLLFTTHGGTRTLSNPTNTQAGRTGCFWVTQDATGGEGLTLGTSWMTAGGSGLTLSTGANKSDLLCYTELDSTHVFVGVSAYDVKH